MAKSKTVVEADIVRARMIELVDDKGKRKAQLLAGEDATIIHLLDKKGRQRLTLQIDHDGNPAIVLFDGESVPGVSLGVFEKRSRGITIQGPGGNMVTVGAPEPGADPRGDHPNVTIIDDATKRVWSALP